MKGEENKTLTSCEFGGSAHGPERNLGESAKFQRIFVALCRNAMVSEQDFLVQTVCLVGNRC